jgi:hypothetical protein
MRHLRKRLSRLESLLTDSSGHACYTSEWFSYWEEQAEQLFAEGGPTQRIPIAFFDAILADVDKPLVPHFNEKEPLRPDRRAKGNEIKKVCR